MPRSFDGHASLLQGQLLKCAAATRKHQDKVHSRSRLTPIGAQHPAVIRLFLLL